MAAPADASTWQLDVGGSWQQRNRVQSPNAPGGTRFSLDDITGDGPLAGARLEATWPLRERHELRFLAAPLRIDETGPLAGPVNFQGVAFSAGTVRAQYRFDSYRVGWRWRWIDRPELTVHVGATAKLRDADIRLQQGTLRARKSNKGFVPLAHAALERRWGDGWFVAADIDALAGGPGYAVDAGVYLGRRIDARWSVRGGLRFLDGGADNDEVYAFARFTSVYIGLRFDTRSTQTD
jgi:hypothetical protein